MKIDQAQWDAWFREHTPALVLFARQRTRSHAEAEDVVQEALMRFWQGGPSRAADPKAYLYQTVARVAVDRARGERSRRRRERQVGRSRGVAEPMLTCSLERAERDREIESAIRRLPVEQREVLVMKVWGELTFAQIAKVLGLSVNTAASRYRYALEGLRRVLSEEVKQ